MKDPTQHNNPLADKLAPDWQLVPIEQDRITKWAQQNPPADMKRDNGLWWREKYDILAKAGRDV